MNKFVIFAIECKCYFLYFLLSLIILSCGKNDPVEPGTKTNDDKFLFIEMAVYTTGKPIPVDGHIITLGIGIPTYCVNTLPQGISYYPALPNNISENDNILLGVWSGLGPDVGSGNSSYIKSLSIFPHLDTILNTRSRLKMITFSKILNDGSIEIIFMDKTITIPVNGMYQKKERTDSIEINYPFRAQKYEYLEDLYTVRNWGYINKKDVTTSHAFP